MSVKKNLPNVQSEKGRSDGLKFEKGTLRLDTKRKFYNIETF